MHRSIPAIMALALAAAPVPGAAADLEDLSLEALLGVQVSSASRFRQEARNAPAMVTVVSRQQILDHGWTTLAELLDAVPGLFVTTDRSYRYLGVRGFLRPADYNTNILLLIDGIPVNDGIYNQASLGTELLLDMSVIDRVEFVPGPGSSVYGSNAILGVINVVTASARQLEGTRASLFAGSEDALGASVSHASAGATYEFLAAAAVARRDGENVYLPATEDDRYGLARGLDWERSHRVMMKYGWGEFSLFGAYYDRRKAYPTAAYFTLFGDRRAVLEDRQLLLALTHQGEAAPGVSLLTRASFGALDFLGGYPYEAAPNLNRDLGRSRWWRAEAQATDTRLDGHTLVYGLEYRSDYRLTQRNYDTSPYTTFLSDQRDAYHGGLYVQDEWRLDGWRINAGLRVDHYGTFGTAVSPRVAAIQRVGPDTTIKYLFGTAYRAPNAYELYYHDGPSTMKANPDLEPERVRSLELGVEHVGPAGWVLSGSLFHNRIRDLIGQEVDPADDLLVYRNQGSATVRGVVLSARRKWDNGMHLSGSWSRHLLGQDAAFGRPTHIPGQTAKLDATVPLGAWRATVEGRYLGRRLTYSGHTGGTVLTNLALGGEPAWLAGGRLSLRVENLLDRRIVDPASEEYDHDVLPREGRVTRLTLTWPM